MHRMVFVCVQTTHDRPSNRITTLHPQRPVRMLGAHAVMLTDALLLANSARTN